MKKTIIALSLFPSLSLVSTLNAVDYTWTGATDTDWGTASNWSPSGIPNLNGTDNATVNGATVYTAGGDLILSTGSTLTIQGSGSWVQEGGIAWIQASGGTLTIEAGGSFDTGTAGNYNNTGANTLNIGGVFDVHGIELSLDDDSMTISAGGNFSTTANFIISADAANFLMTGGIANTAEFKPNGTSNATINGGVFNASLVSFDGGNASKINLGGDGRLNLSGGDNFQGIFALGDDDYVNITSSTSVLFIDNLDEANKDILLASGRVRVNDVNSGVIATAVDGGYEFTSTIPEPSTYVGMMGLATLGVLLVRRRKQ
ncbi:PEP-CTERM sorting domain-containing protein [Cerasicoccus maritimus]|uniref:PEP-CTERM sorting domain-containing protein n=1 Tax=Cerasicoccus maritimus TaxID=490089 RepID=UPI0028524B5D|nr:PEP-CTERM sorting domain-containing protein [Cerasicoccus maritimus]